MASQESRVTETAHLCGNMFRVSQEIRLNTSSSAEVARYCNTANADSENDCIFGKYQRTPDAGEYIHICIKTKIQMCIYVHIWEVNKFSFVWLKKLHLYKQMNILYIHILCFLSLSRYIHIFIPLTLFAQLKINFTLHTFIYRHWQRVVFNQMKNINLFPHPFGYSHMNRLSKFKTTQTNLLKLVIIC